MNKKFKILVLLNCLILLVLLMASCKYFAPDFSFPPDETTPEPHVHTFGPWVILEQPFPEKAGHQTRTCDSCGETEEKTIVIAKDLSYKINYDGETCTITGIGSCTDAHIYVLPEIDGYRVTRIGEFAFFECTTLESIVFSEGLECVDNNAFFNCSNLSGVVLPDTVTRIDANAFGSCRALATIAIPNGVTTIKEYTFRNCSSLNSVTLPDTLTRIDVYAFRGCTALKNITIPNGVTVIGAYAFSGCESLTDMHLPNSVLGIASNAFRNCSKLKSIHFGRDFISIGESAFSGCSALFQITVDEQNAMYYSAGNCVIDRVDNVLIFGCNGSVIPQGVTAIEDWAFANCKSLQSIVIPEGVTSIGFGAFSGCENLQSVSIANSVERVQEAAFEGCDKLITVENGIHYVDKWIVDSDRDLVSVNPRGNTVGIADVAFAYCPNLAHVSIGSVISKIGKEVFVNCSHIEDITVASDNPTYYSQENCLIEKGSKTLVLGCKNSTIPKDICYIGESAFRNCTFPKYPRVVIEIPDGVLSIGDYAFWGCTSVKEIALPTSLVSLGHNVFTFEKGAPPVIYKGTLEQWVKIEKGNGWNGLDIQCNGENWSGINQSGYTLGEVVLYQETSETSTVLRVIPKETEIYCIQENSDWYYVEYDGVRGYVLPYNVTNVDIFATDFIHFLTPKVMYVGEERMDTFRYPGYLIKNGYYTLNTEVVVLGTNGEWALVQRDDGTTCYMEYHYLLDAPFENPDEVYQYKYFWGVWGTPTEYVSGDGIPLYKTPSDQSEVLLVLPEGNEVTLLKSGHVDDNNWCYVVVEDPNDPTSCVFGYMFANSLTSTKEN